MSDVTLDSGFLAKVSAVAEAGARAGGEVVAKYHRTGVEMRSKESFNLVSDADIEAEAAVVRTIRETFPDHAILAEEGHRADGNAEDLWVIDPLDGTNNFAHKVPQFSVSVAYCRCGRPMCGVVFNPVTGEWYTASRGGGAYANGERVHVGGQRGLSEALVSFGFYYDRGAMMQATLAAIADFFGNDIHGVRRMGCASLDLCWVGIGRFGVFFEHKLSPWDFAAGALFVEEAGGKVTTCGGEPLPMAPTGVLATNGLLHEVALEITRRHLVDIMGSR
ncbi:MAG TPA: inositol monophosphatase family protein [Verrucomicrobiae bacterium]|nr:inositol monophosphatase family protein [Verrucomicrobiae bacterium]